MTFRAFMAENGYNVQTTFWEDFSAADIFGLSAIQDTFNRAFEEWKGNCKYLTELVLVLNHKIWQHYKKKPTVAAGGDLIDFYVLPHYLRLWRRCMMHSGDRRTSTPLKT